MKKYLVPFLSILLATSCTSKIDFAPLPPVPLATDVLISEVSTAINTDPLASGTRTHYVELYNGTGSNIDFANYAIGYMAVTDVGTLSPWSFTTGNFIVLRKIVATGKCYVIASPQADPLVVKSDTTWGTTSTLAAQASSPLQLSGNSAIALLKKDATGTYTLGGTNYKIIDVFGSPLVARVTSTGSTSTRNNIMWTIAGENADTRNRTFFRKSSIIIPTLDWATAKGTTVDNSEWKISGDRAWDYSNVGLPTQ
jgi:hypothetical protein